MNDLLLAWQTFNQDKNTRDNRLVRWTQGFLVLFLVTLTLTSQSVQQYLTGNLQTLLGSDLVIAQYHPLKREHQVALQQRAKTMSETRLYSLTITNGSEWQRAQLKLVDDAYPVQGNLTISTALGAGAQPTNAGPAIGEVWLDSRLFVKLKLEIGQTISVSGVELKVAAILGHEPDRLMEGHTVAMRAMAHVKSLSGTGVPKDGVKYRYLITGEQAARETIKAWAKTTVPDAQLIDRHSGSHPLSGYWKRVENFMGLASVLLFFMAAIAINMAGRRQLDQQKHRLALYLSMGVSLSRGVRLTLVQWSIGFVASLVPAVALAYGAQYGLMLELSNQFPGIEGGLHAGALGKTCLLVLALLLATQVPSFMQLKHTSVVALIRQQPQGGFAVWQLLWSFGTLAALAALYSDNMLLTGMTLTAMGATLLLMMGLTWVTLSVGERLGRNRAGILPFTMFIMKKRLLSKSTQILGLGLCSTLLLFTLMLMKDIGGMMLSQNRTENGNLFISDALPQHVPALEAWAIETGSTIKQLRPFSRAMVTRVNGELTADAISQPSDTLRRLERPVRLSWSENVPANNSVTAGSWWQPNTENWQQISVESEVLTDLGLELGDRLTFQADGKDSEFEIVATHDFKAGNSLITFWFQVPPAAISHMVPSIHYMGSMELSESAWSTLAPLWKKNPTLGLLSLKEMTERFDQTLAMVTKLTVGFSGMILLLALFVIVASVSGFEADDRKRNGLLRSMGLSSRDCLKLAFYEWFITGTIAAFGAIAGTWIAGVLVYESQFSMVYNPDPLWIIGTLTITCAVVCSVGLYFCRESLQGSVREVMAG